MWRFDVQLVYCEAELYEEVLESVRLGEGGVFFADGPGGSGKTFVEEALLHAVRGQGQVALACAWSGVAATLLEGGRTCHSTFGLPVPMPREAVSCSISAQSGRAEVLRMAKLIIWDEAPMSPEEAVTAADNLLRDLTGIDALFGGKIANVQERFVKRFSETNSKIQPCVRICSNNMLRAVAKSLLWIDIEHLGANS